MNKQIKRAVAALLCALVTGLQGCGTTAVVSKGLDDEGRAAEVVFPDIARSAWLKEGTFVNPDNLRAVAPGLSKDQLYDLLGRPHFAEGLSNVREWDYVFNFRTGMGDEFVSCQFKVLFDKDMLARTFHWQPVSCADRLAVQTPDVATVPEVAPEVVADVTPEVATIPARKTCLQADGLFMFGKSGLADLLPAGRERIDSLIDELHDVDQVQRLIVTGHTDRLGSRLLNEALSLARAVTVRDYLVSRTGLPEGRVTAQGRGPSEPLVQCAEVGQEPLIACLAPNRRVEIEVEMRRVP